MQRRTVWGLVLLGAVAVSSVLGCGGDEVEEIAEPVASFVGGNVCAECHQLERDLWSGSHHDLAMQVASEETVLGDFDGTEFTHFGVTSTFSRRNGGFFMRTEGPAGELVDYEIKYVFGVEPLQQYLVEFPGGRFQVSSLCWDTRPAAEGGQRWFHVYDDEEITHDDVLHWTGPNQNWNFMCAECHSTDLQKNYDLASDSYRTQWSEINVSCEACHGPGSNHVTWARDMAPGETSADYVKMGLQVSLKNPDGGTWVFDPGEKVARRTTPRTSRSQIESCARCHSRRSVILAAYEHGQPLLDTHMPALLEERLYHADGQISEEVYVYGSFLQSVMYQQGVTCSDCHEPHGLNLIAEGNNLCSRCHTPEAYDSPDHHFHQAASTGASCVECHMPETTYMVVDPRRDHSIRIPRPDLSVSLGTPNACVLCHVDQSDQWAADAVEEWYPRDAAAPPHYAEAFDAGRKGGAGAEVALSELVTSEAPGLVRASALTLLGPMDIETTLRAIGSGVADDDPLVRRAALVALAEAQEGARLPLGYPLLLDPIRGVRIEAVNALASVRSRMTNAQREIFDRAADEYIAAQLANADRFMSHINLGVHYLNVGQRAEAARGGGESRAGATSWSAAARSTTRCSSRSRARSHPATTP